MARGPEQEAERRVGPKGRYRLLHAIGANRFASIWAGIDDAEDSPVLVEVVRFAPPADADAAKALRNEMVAIQDLPLHPGLLRLRALHTPPPPGRLAVLGRLARRVRRRRGVDTDAWLLVFEPFEAATLEHRVAFDDVTSRELIDAVVRVGEVVEALHAAGAAHGTLGPTTVLLSGDDEVRVIDARVGLWAGGGDPEELRRQDVAALARLATDLLPTELLPPIVVRASEAGSAVRPSAGELVASLREAATLRGDAVRIERPYALAVAGQAGAAPAHPRDRPPADRPAEPERVIVVPEPGPEPVVPEAGSPARVDRFKAWWVTPVTTGGSDRWSSSSYAAPGAPPTEPPARWMQVVGVVASAVMITAVIAAAVYLLRGSL